MTHIGNGTGNHAAFITATTILMTENTTRATNNISPMLLVLLLLSPHACVTQSYGQRHACSSSRPSWCLVGDAISPFLEPSKALPNCQVTSHTAAAGMHAYAWQPHMALYSCGLWLLRPLASPIPGIDCMIGGNGESSPRLSICSWHHHVLSIRLRKFLWWFDLPSCPTTTTTRSAPASAPECHDHKLPSRPLPPAVRVPTGRGRSIMALRTTVRWMWCSGSTHFRIILLPGRYTCCYTRSV